MDNLDTKTKLISISVISLLVLSWAVYVVFISAPGDFPLNKVVSIEEGKTFNEISADFKEQKLIRSSFVFETFAWLCRKETKVKAGEYFFEHETNSFNLIRIITSDNYLNNLVKITVPEGYNLRDIGFIFENRGMWQAEELWEITGLPTQPDSLEGFLFPDTYFVPINIKPGSMVEVMRDTFNKKVSEELSGEIEKTNRSLTEIITMASLLEKEAAKKEDRELISGILWKRLESEMPLQIDAIFPYIIGKNSFQLTKEDLKTDSPYNTYLYTGLPAGPIANPGLDSIMAALYPKMSPYWFYLSDKNSKLHYSVTYEEHLLNKEKYLGN